MGSILILSSGNNTIQCAIPLGYKIQSKVKYCTELRGLRMIPIMPDFILLYPYGLPWWYGLGVKNSLIADFNSFNARICLQCGRHGFDPWVGKILWRRAWQPTPVSLPGEFHEQKNLVGPSAWGHKELDMTEGITLSLSLKASSRDSVLVCQGCHNKRSWAGWLKQQKFIFSQFWRLEV